MSGVSYNIMAALDDHLYSFLSSVQVAAKVAANAVKGATSLALDTMAREWFVNRMASITVGGNVYSAVRSAVSSDLAMTVQLTSGLLDAVVDGDDVVISSSFAGRLAMLNEKFDPMAGSNGGECWLRATMLPGEPEPHGIGPGGYNLQKGTYQVDVRFSLGSATARKSAVLLADAIASWFLAGTALTSGGVSIYVRSAGASQFLEESAWFFVPVRIGYEGSALNA